MSFSASESSRYLGEPINLYLFRYGVAAHEFYAYTDAEVIIEHDTIAYVPIPIDRGKINSSGALDKTKLGVSTPANSELANLFLIYPPSSVTTLIVRQGHLSDDSGEYPIVWTGRVLSCARKGSKAEFNCEPVSTQLRRNGLRRRYQFGCPHALYGPDCRANKAAATLAVTAVSTSGTRVELPNGWSARADKYVGGMVTWTPQDSSPETRTILRVENGGNTLLLSGRTRGLTAGMTVQVILGCNHKSGTSAQPDGDCGPLHNNILNFGGQERIPFKNPVGLTNQYY